MYAKVITKNNKIYYSPVLVLKYWGRSSWAVVFDETLTKLIRIKYWSDYVFSKVKRPSLQIVDYDSNNYCIFKDDIKSIWNKKIDLLKCNFGLFTKKHLEYAKRYLKKYESKNYTTVKNAKDLDNLRECAFDFHDGYLLMKTNKNEYEELLFNTTWGSYIKLRVSGNVDNTVDPLEIISDSTSKIENNRIQLNFNNMFDFEYEKNDMHLIVDRLEYKDYFEIRLEIKELKNYSIEKNDLIVIDSKKKYIIPMSKNIIFEDDDEYLKIFFESDDIMYCLSIIKRSGEVDELILALKDAGFLIEKVSRS